MSARNTSLDRTIISRWSALTTIGPLQPVKFVKIIPAQQNVKLTIPYSEIAALTFTGRDSAAGKSWEAWVKKYLEKKAAGEKNIELQPESLD